MTWWTDVLEWLGVSVPSLIIAGTAYTTDAGAIDPGWALILGLAQIAFIALYVATDFADLSGYAGER